jgi:hypothetical protein
MKIQADGLRGVGFLCETVFCETTGGDGLNLLILRRID